MRLVFAGTPDFSVPALDALVRAGHEIVAVYTQPDRPAGRGRKLGISPVKQRALELGIPVHQPESLKSASVQAAFAALEPEAMIVVAYGLLLPQAILDIPRHGCLNIHASLLPRWRGAAPIQRAIAAGDVQTGVGIMQMEKGLDTGPVLLEKRTPISDDDTGGSLHDRLAALGADAIVEALAQLESLTQREQDSKAATYAHKLNKDEARIDWQRPAAELARLVRAFNPWPVAFFEWEGKNIRAWAARPLPGQVENPPGEVVHVAATGIDVATGDGVLRLVRLQPPGKRPMTAGEFLNGHAIKAGGRFD